MIHVSKLCKTYGTQVLFIDANVSIGEKDKIGLIGRNGSGKSTFLKVLLGQEGYDSGIIDRPDRVRIKALEQHLQFTEPTIVQQVCTKLAGNAHTETWRAEAILLGLGFTTEDFTRAPAEFSSGMQVRLRLAEALVSPAQLLLLDEPTNYLDIVSLRWLERFLQQWNGAFILVTHDQAFMERVVTHTVGIHRGRMRKITGGPVKILKQIAKDEQVFENTRVNTLKKQAKTKEFISKFRAGARSAGLVQSRIKALAKQKVAEKLEYLPEIAFNFRSELFRGNTMIEATNIHFAYEEIDPIITKFSLKVRAKERIAIIGRNGKGKSTLLNVLIQKLEHQSGKIKQHVDLKIGYFSAANIADLNPQNTILSELMELPDVSEQQVRSVCGALLFSGNTVKKYISSLSGGEKSRVCFAKVLLSSVHLLVLDEPTNHLDMESCQALTKALQEFDGTVLLVSHDEKILSALANRLVVFDNEGIALYEKTYDEFLQDIGWKEEEMAGVQTKKIKVSDTKQQYLDIKALRKDLRATQGLQKKLLVQVDKLEQQQIVNAEALQKQYQEGNRDMMEKLGREAKQIADDITSTFTALEDAMAKEVDLQHQLDEAT